MSEWPREMDVAPIREWPGVLTPGDERRDSPFRAGFPATLTLLDFELRAIRAAGVELLVAIDPGQFRRNGLPRADARASHPGVVLSFEIEPGRVSYPCDRFTSWQDNLRAIALALEALRKVDRYGVTSDGEQYRGFLAIEPPVPVAAEDDLAWLRRYTGLTLNDPPAVLVRRALRRAHPDAGGSPADFQTVIHIEERLREAGQLS